MQVTSSIKQRIVTSLRRKRQRLTATAIKFIPSSTTFAGNVGYSPVFSLKSLGVGFQWALFFFCLAFFIYQIQTSSYPLSEVTTFLLASGYMHYPWLLLVLFLMPLNHSLEALKWKAALHYHLPISFKKAYQGVLLGIGLGFFTPHSIGDYMGRMAWVQQNDQRKAAASSFGAIMLCRWVQLAWTLAFGFLSLVILSLHSNLSAIFKADLSFWRLVAYALIPILFVLLILYFFKNRLFSFYQKLRSYLQELPLRQWLKLTFWSFLRYLVFSSQLALLFLIFVPEISVLQAFAATWFIFLVKSVIFSYNLLGDLGVRELGAAVVIHCMDWPFWPAVLATTLVWLINLALPAIAGIFLVFKLKVLRL